MSEGQRKSFIILGSKLSESIDQQDYGDKTLKIGVETIDYIQEGKTDQGYGVVLHNKGEGYQ